MNLRDQIHSVPGFKTIGNKTREQAITEARKKQAITEARKKREESERQRLYQSQHTNFESTMLTAATILISGVCVWLMILAFPEYAGQMIDQGREIAAVAMGVVK